MRAEVELYYLKLTQTFERQYGSLPGCCCGDAAAASGQLPAAGRGRARAGQSAGSAGSTASGSNEGS